MNEDIAIKIEGLGKKYVIKHQKKEPYQTFQGYLIQSFRSVLNTLNPFKKTYKDNSLKEEFWALKDINLEIKKGDKVGIIGRNGAGKSTLLKILSRITEPTEGKVQINGRIASLLEVGTGFHPELTGKENIFLNGSILGMSRKEIKTKFDQIVEFAEVEKFLDTPVKRYSSGMYVRLAFSVAAHLEPDILVVDEVLAVGDLEFQKKCMGKMDEVSKAGRTILFVSHNMGAIEQLCDSIVHIKNGLLIDKSNNVRQTIQKFILGDSKYGNSYWENTLDEYNNPNFQPIRFEALNKHKTPTTEPFKNNQEITISITGNIQKIDTALQVGFAIYNNTNELLFWSIFNDSPQEKWPKLKVGVNNFSTFLPKNFLNEGEYRVELIIALYFRAWIIEPLKNSPSITFNIQGGLSDSPYWMVKRPGVLAPILNWRVD